ncbi:hypothetical protein T03_3528 [Trichinella britovi]|uniref:Uncharacterized protein n=1 Tax=Trichinella britovi TaxID=45882 RepID=A0A0V1D206_TRIBR|nr:hypothetical protein T03_3528 [Trichinella britovi]
METGGCLSSFDYCSVHVSTVISHLSQQFCFLIFFIVTVRMNFMHFVIAMGCVNTSDAEDEDKEVSISFDYCSVHVSTVISHLSQQFCFLIFFIVTQWVVSVQWNYFYKLEYLSLMIHQMLKTKTKIDDCINIIHVEGCSAISATLLSF